LSRINCPQCGTIDQVQSVPGLYEAQTSTYAGTSGGYGYRTVHTYGSSSSLLADQIAPPPVPRLTQPTGGCAVAILAAFAAGAGLMVLPLLLTSDDPDAGKNALITFCALGLPFALAAVALTVKRARERRQSLANFRAYQAAFPSLLAVWNAAFLCRRCHLAFFPAGVMGLTAPRSTPAAGFQQLVATLAAGGPAG